MNVIQLLSFIHKAKLVSLAGYGWKVNGRHTLPFIGTFILVSLLIAHLTPALGLSEETTLKPSIKQISKTKINSSYLYLFEYCSLKDSLGIMGFQVISNVESVPVLIDSNIKPGECQEYGVKVKTDKSEFVKTKLFTNNDLLDLIKNFENKKMILEDKLINELQKLNTYHKTNANNEKIVEQIDKVEFLKELIKSVRSSIILLKSV